MAIIQTPYERYENGVLVESGVHEREETPEEIEERAYRANLSTKTNDMIAAVDAARSSIQNNAFTGAGDLKTALNRIKRAIIALDRELSKTDMGS